MNKRFSTESVVFAFFFCILMIAPGPAHAQYACASEVGDVAGKRPFDNPCPTADDVVLPMPGNLFMVFRNVNVPGQEFWGNPARNIELGDPDAKIFEGPRLVSVAGSFPSVDGKSWRIIMGKYEVTVAQYAAVFGDGDIPAGLRVLADRTDLEKVYQRALSEDASPEEVRRILASPARGLRARDHEEFINRYTDWCYQDRMCRPLMPKFGEMPGFFRLPTEIEWEYSARRGAEKERVSYLPFDAKDATDYAYVSTSSRVRSGPTTIGRLKPTNFGIHDLYGNVAELTDGRFLAELGQGKPGMFTSRGGSYAFTPDKLRPSLRTEVQDYRVAGGSKVVPLRSARLGIRLAIGSQTVPNPQTLDEIQKSYTNYRSTDRLQSSAGKSTQADVLTAAEPLVQIDALLRDYARKTNLPAELVEEVSALTAQSRVQLVRTSESLAIELTNRAVSTAAEAGRSLFLARRANRIIERFEETDSDFARRTVENARQQSAEYEMAFSQSVNIYSETIRRLAGYGSFAESSLEAFSRTNPAGPDKVGFELAQAHTSAVLDGGANPDLWTAEIREAFENDILFER